MTTAHDDRRSRNIAEGKAEACRAGGPASCLHTQSAAGGVGSGPAVRVPAALLEAPLTAALVAQLAVFPRNTQLVEWG